MSALHPNLRAAVVTGAWESRRMLRLRSGWGLVAGIGAVSVAVAAVPNHHPLHEQGVFSLQSFAGLDQLLATFFAAAALLLHRPIQHAAWWPAPAVSILSGRMLGSWLGAVLLLALCVAVQAGVAAITGDLTTQGPLDPTAVSLAPAYLSMLLLAGAFALVLHAWALFLATVLRPTAALLTLFVLVLAGFLLSGLPELHVGLRPLLILVPHLGSLSPLQARAPGAGLGALWAYAAAHAGCVLALTAVAAQIQQRRGIGFETTSRTG